MKKIIIMALAVLTLGVSTVKANWFHDDSEKERRIEVQQQLQQQQQANNGMGIVIVILAVGCVTALGIGAAIGSRTRREARRHESPNE